MLADHFFFAMTHDSIVVQYIRAKLNVPDLYLVFLLSMREVVRPFFNEIDWGVLVSTIASYQQMGCWGGPVDIPVETYDKLVDAFLHAGVITRRHPYNAAIASVVE